jgi:two-component system nitrate/nitrite sensor histidine kinase NarX
MDRLSDAVEVTVKDDGQGFDPDEAATAGDDHFGLSIMRARAARIAGQVKIDSLPGQGTRVRLTWPLRSEPGDLERLEEQRTPGR